MSNFKVPKEMKRNSKISEYRGVYRCNDCKEVFLKFDKFKNHMKKRHLQNKTRKCGCGMTLMPFHGYYAGSVLLCNECCENLLRNGSDDNLCNVGKCEDCNCNDWSCMGDCNQKELIRLYDSCGPCRIVCDKCVNE